MIVANQLGPLEFVNGEWVIGDRSGHRSDYMKLGRRGLIRCANGVDSPPIPWSRFQEIDLTAAASRAGNSRMLAGLANVALNLSGIARSGGGSAYVSAILRHPYEDWKADFSHHARKYSRQEILLAGEFLKQAVGSGRGERLGDPAWVSEMIGKLAGLPSDSSRALRAEVQRIVTS